MFLILLRLVRRQTSKQARDVKPNRVDLIVPVFQIASRCREVRRRGGNRAPVVSVPLDESVTVGLSYGATLLLNQPAIQIETPTTAVGSVAVIRVGRPELEFYTEGRVEGPYTPWMNTSWCRLRSWVPEPSMADRSMECRLP